MIIFILYIISELFLKVKYMDTFFTEINFSKQFVINYELLKAIPHKDCASDAKSDFSLDCAKSMQAYWRMSKRFCAR